VVNSEPVEIFIWITEPKIHCIKRTFSIATTTATAITTPVTTTTSTTTAETTTK